MLKNNKISNPTKKAHKKGYGRKQTNFIRSNMEGLQIF